MSSGGHIRSGSPPEILSLKIRGNDAFRAKGLKSMIFNPHKFTMSGKFLFGTGKFLFGTGMVLLGTGSIRIGPGWPGCVTDVGTGEGPHARCQKSSDRHPRPGSAPEIFNLKVRESGAFRAKGVKSK